MEFLDLNSTLIGAAIALLPALATVFWAHWLQARRDQRKQQELLAGLLQGIHVELETNWVLYQEGAGERLEQLGDGMPLGTFALGNQDYFTIYDGNTSLIGQIKDAELRRAIVTTYTSARVLLDSYAMHNMLTKTCFRLKHDDQEKFQTAVADLAQHTQALKTIHFKVKEQIAETLKILRIQGFGTQIGCRSC